MKTKLMLVASIVALPLVGVAVTLDETVKNVLNTNPLVQERINYFRSVKQDVSIAESGYYPKLDLVAGIGKERTKNNNTGYENKTLDRQEAAIVLTQNIFEGFGTQKNVEKQNYRVNSAAYSTIEKANQLSLSMVEAYTELFKQKELLSFAEANVETHKKINSKIKERIDSGVGANSELEQSSSRMALAESNYIVQMNNYEDAVSNFIKVYGSFVHPDDLDEPMAVKTLPTSKDQAIAEANKLNPSLKVQRANIKVARSNFNITKKAFYPQLDLEARQDWNRDVGGVEGDDDSSSIMLRFRYNLFNGNADTSSKQKSISELHQEMKVFDDLKRRVEESIRLSWVAYTSLEKQMSYLITHKDLSQKTLTSYVEEFDLGRRTLLDILDTEEELYSADRELVVAKYDYILAQYRIIESIGTLTSYIDKSFANQVGLGEESNSQSDVVDELPQTEEEQL
ncbi:TolC family outer membrane protein [Sulfurospirillum arcachonense]|uniref:TolC family outer membrane protein n=1 Tax=Sulfurospirillum arcachonense TaxID=57666 RepID=UPI00046A5A4E|nr:TolC family outer membrane protein [Sulfurospirillum arcachonense]